MVLSVLCKAEDLWGKVKARNEKVPDPHSVHETTSDNLECHMVAMIRQSLLHNLKVFRLAINFPHDVFSCSPCAFQRSLGLPATVSQLILFFICAFSKIIHEHLLF